MNFNELGEIIGYKFRNVGFLERAFTHPSMISEQTIKGEKIKSYERLELLGDSVLGFIITELLIKHYKNESEGNLSKRKNFLVCGQTLAEIGKKLDIGRFIIMSKGEENSGGRKNEHNLENIMEALIGAIYLDGGLEKTKQFVLRNWEQKLKRGGKPPKEPKCELQELSQKYYGHTPKYVLIEKSGMDHSPTFKSKVKLAGLKDCFGEGKSKKLSEKRAAQKMIDHIYSLNSTLSVS